MTVAERKSPIRRSSALSKAGLVGAAAILLAVVGYGVWWWFVAEEFRAGIEQWRVNSTAKGLDVHWKELKIVGFPGRVDAIIDSPKIMSREGYVWQTREMRLGLIPWALNAITLDAPGRHDLVLPTSNGPVDWSLTAGSLIGQVRGDTTGSTASIMIDDGLILEGDVEVSRLVELEATLHQPVAEAVDPDALHPPVAYDLAISAIHEDLRRTIEWPFADTTQRSDVRAVLHGHLLMPLTQSRLVDWRDRGGSLELRGFSSRIGPLRVVGDGAVSVDRALQPVGAMSISVTGYDIILEMLVRDGRVPADSATLIQGVLDLLARRSSDEGKSIDVAISVQDNVLFIGPFELGRLPPVVWPE